MSDAAAFTATFSDLKTIKTRSVVSFHFEVAIEQADQALAILGGLPKSGAEIHVAIARLQAPAKEVMPHRTDQGPHNALPHSSGGGAPIYHDPIGPPRLRDEPRETRPEMEEPARKVDTTKSERAKASYRMSDDPERAVTRAAMLCNDQSFISWMLSRHGYIGAPNEDIAHLLRAELGITTRREIATNERAYAAFLALEAEYKLAIGQMAEIR